MGRRTAVLGLLAFSQLGCLQDNPAATSGGTGSDSDTGSGSGSGADTGVVPGGAFLGCPAGDSCTLVIVSQTLDDRLEVFSPDDPGGAVYRGAIDVDIKPNVPDGDFSGDKLDEPFGLALAGGHLHAVLGHYPTREEGTLLSMPFDFFADRMAGDLIALEEIHTGLAFTDDVRSNAFAELEPIFVSVHGSGRLLVGTFNNDLFSSEDEWIGVGKLLVVDPADPSAPPGVAELAGLEGGDCLGASQVLDLGGDAIAVACDGNEAVAFLDASGIGDGTVADAAAGITGKLCDLPQQNNRRVRYLAPDGAAGVVVGEGPTPLDTLSDANLVRVSAANCGLQITRVGTGGESQLGEVVALGADAWLFASGPGMLASGNRGIFVARDSGGAEFEVCGPIPGFETFFEVDGGMIDPFSVVVGPNDTLAVGAGPPSPGFTADPGFGRVLWATLSGVDDPCTMSATVVDLSATAPIEAANPRTWRRAPNAMIVVEVSG